MADTCSFVNCGPNGKCIKDANGNATCACNTGFQMPPDQITCVARMQMETQRAIASPDSSGFRATTLALLTCNHHHLSIYFSLFQPILACTHIRNGVLQFGLRTGWELCNKRWNSVVVQLELALWHLSLWSHLPTSPSIPEFQCACAILPVQFGLWDDLNRLCVRCT
ncbi:unnamed protein product [Closterium sp. NIES-53]